MPRSGAKFRIYAEAHKGRRDMLLPMTKDFYDFIMTTPENERHGPVFPLNALETGKPISVNRIGKMVGKFGKKAEVIIDKAAKQYATAPDLRRAFGTRWAKRVLPAVLQKLMRHRSIETAMKYYVAFDADDMAADLWKMDQPKETVLTFRTQPE